jgi:hypothetical protein
MNLNAVLEAACEVQSVLEREDAEFCFIGGLAIQRWGEPRFTNDADLNLLTRFVEDERWTDFLLSRFEARYPNAKRFALTRRVLLLRATNGVGIDISLGALDFEANSMRRASFWKLPSHASLKTCCAEDLIVHKAFADRDRDWLDVDTILMRQGNRLDTSLIFQELKPLVELKESPEILDKLRRYMRKREVLWK